VQRYILAGLLLCGEEERDTQDDSQAAEAWSLIASNCTFRWSSGSFERLWKSSGNHTQSRVNK